jgi:hypothetical protein
MIDRELGVVGGGGWCPVAVVWSDGLWFRAIVGGRGVEFMRVEWFY